MKLDELEFETLECESPNLEFVNRFFELVEEPVTSGRIFKGAGGGYNDRFPARFGLREKSDTDTVFEDDNKLLNWPSDCRERIYWVDGEFVYRSNLLP